MNFAQLKQQVYEWSTENFGDEQPHQFPLIGAGEEAGELTTSVLKRAQGIDDTDKYSDRVGDEAEMDAIGDVFIYLADFAARYEARPGDTPPEDVDKLLKFYERFGYLCRKIRQPDESERAVRQATAGALEALHELAEVRDFDVDEVVKDTWKEVSGREWDSDIKQS